MPDLQCEKGVGRVRISLTWRRNKKKLNLNDDAIKIYWWKHKDKFSMKCDNVLYVLIIFICLHSYISSTLTATLETTTNTSLTSIMSSSTSIVTFLDSPIYVEVEERDEAVLECRVKSLASHHTVSRF